MEKFKKLKSSSLVEDVIRQIEDAILVGTYKSGDKLPSTRQLQEVFGASLGTIREGLAILEQKGLIIVRKGAKGGFFIREMSTQPMTESLEMLMRHFKLSLRELFEFRATIEAGLIRLVVKRANDEQVRSFLKFKKKFQVCLNHGQAGWYELIEKEMALRKEFLAVINNRTFEAVLLPINNNILIHADRHLRGGNDEIKAAYDYWRKILSAIADRDEERAASLTKKMIFDFMELMLR